MSGYIRLVLDRKRPQEMDTQNRQLNGENHQGSIIFNFRPN